ncbi:MAG: putative metal-binding motif-containing protein [Sandaracinus sp.]
MSSFDPFRPTPRALVALTLSMLAPLAMAGCGGDSVTPGADDAAFDANLDGATLDAPLADAPRTDVGPGCADADGDGVRAASCGGTDCDDTDPEIHPGQMEVCDAAHRDEDCDPSTVGFRDQDGDGYVDAACCNGTLCGDDCNDTRPTAHPGSTEACDSFDNDCDTAIDEGVLETFYPDTDGDGFGNAAGTTVTGCTTPPGYSTLAMATDCDDTMRGVNPSAMEICDAAMVDENCDGEHNPPSLCSCNAGDPPRACALPGICASGREMCSGGAWGMCTVMPRAESCNGLDDDCDNSVDEMLTVLCYADTDNDTFPDALDSAPSTHCPDASRTSVGGCPTGTTNRVPDPTNVDCGPADSTVHPGVAEVCNGIDDNCVMGIDEGLTVACYTDADNDHYAPSGATASARCIDATRPAFGGCPVGLTSMPPGSAPDCNDSATGGGINPGATEVCDAGSVDEDCDGMHNEGCNCTVTGTPVSCQMALGLMGACASGTTLCTAGAWGPCSVMPTTETCNTVDDDCDGTVDDGVDVACCTDTDRDGWTVSLTPTMRACSCPPGTITCPGVGTALDCNDSSMAVHPTATEICNGIDDNCTMGIDEGLTVVCYADADNDHYAPSSATMSSQCRDSSAPRASFGGCPTGYTNVAPGGAPDCNDASGAVHPGATEVCNGIDDNCVGGVDEGVTTTYYRDADGDTYGNAAMTTQACSLPSGYTTRAMDCNDGDITMHPGAAETCDNIDSDCSSGGGATTDEDVDGDHHSPTTSVCSGGWAKDDCLDTNAAVHPGASYGATPYCTDGSTTFTDCGTYFSCTASCGALVRHASFDFDCSGAEQPQPSYASCAASGGICTMFTSACPPVPQVPGTAYSGADCGRARPFWGCACSGTSCVGSSTVSRTLSCR